MTPPLQTWTATVTRIIDGDTFDVAWLGGYTPPTGLLDRIRVAGVDTNETTTNQSFSAEATDRLAELIPVGTVVTLQARDENSNSANRPVRHVFVDGDNIAITLIEEGLGLAVSYEFEPDFRTEYFTASEQAQTAGVGMWEEGASGGDPATWPDVDMFVNYDAAGDDFLNVNDEFIHIQNNGPGVADLTGWAVRKAGKDDTTDLPAGTTLAAGESFRIYMGVGTDTANAMYLNLTEPFLDNLGDVIYLRDEHLNIRATQLWPDSIFKGELKSIVIDDVQYNAPGADDATNPNGEWLVIRNAGAETVDLTHWRIKDNSAHYVFDDGETLAAGETLKIFVGQGTDGAGVRYWGNTTGILNNDFGKLEVHNEMSQAVDEFGWGTSTPEVDTSTTDENPRGAIRLTANFDAEGSDTANINGEWIALFNTSDSAIDIGGYTVKSGSHTYEFASGTSLASGANLRLLVGSGTDTDTVKYWGKTGAILSNGGDYAELIDTDNETILRHEWPNTSGTITDYGIVISHVNHDAPGSDNANVNGEFIVLRNASTTEQNLVNWKLVVGSEQLVFTDSTPLAAGASLTVYMGSGTNTANSVYWGNSSAQLYSSGSRSVELLSDTRDVIETHSWGSAASPKQSVGAALDITINYDAQGVDAENPNGEWVNLHNISSQTISLDGYHLNTDGTDYDFDAGDTIAAGARMRVYLGNGTDAGMDRYANGALNVFNNTADGVELRRDDIGGAVDSFTYPFTAQPYVRADLEISMVNFDAPGVDATNPNGEWIEITNNGSSAADLRDWRLQYQSGTFYDWNDTVMIGAGETIRISMGQGTDTATQFYWGNTAAALSNTSGTLTLLTPYRTTQDTNTWSRMPGEGSTVVTGPVASIVIDDVQMNAPGVDEDNPNGEWVIIRNAGSETADLTNWRIKDNSADYLFLEEESLDPGETLKIFIGTGTDGPGVRYWGNASSILNNDNGRLEIWNPNSFALDTYTWGTEQSLMENPRGAIRLSANYDTEGSDNANPNGEWVALFNSSDSDIDIGGFSLISGSHIYNFAAGTTLAAGANMRVLVGSGTDTDTIKHWGKSGAILGNSGDRVELIDADEEVLLRHEWPNTNTTPVTDYGIVIDRVNFDAPGSDNANPNGEWITLRNASVTEQNLVNWKIKIDSEQFVILEDTPLAAGATMTIYMGAGTDTANSLYWGNSSAILYNSGSRGIELMAPNRDVVETHSWGSAASAKQSIGAAVEITINYDAQGADAENPNGEWVNITNVSSQTISLDGYHLNTDGTDYVFDAGDTIAAGARMRVYLGNGTDSGLDRYANGALNTFNNTADGVELRDNDTDGAVSSFAYPFTATALSEETLEISMVNFDAPGVDATNPNGEWLEITNTGSTDVDLRDWRVQYQTGTFYDFNTSAVIEAGDTVRLSMGQGTDTSSQFYWGNTSAALSNTMGQLTLLTPYRTAEDTFNWTSEGGGGGGPAASIVIDDVQMDAPGSDSANLNGEWVIVRNAGSEAVDLTGWRIKDDSADYIFADEETLDPGETLKIFIGSGTDSAGIRYWGNSSSILNNSDGKLEIWNPNSTAMDAYAWGSEQTLSENVRGAIRLSANYDTEGSDNANPNGEWAALHNTSDSAIDLGGYSLVSGSAVYEFASGTSLAAHTNMRVLIGTGTDTDTVKHWGLSSAILGNSGDRVDLIDPNEEVLLRHEWPNTNTPVTDYGIVIERVAYDAPGSDNANLNGEFVTLRNSSATEQNLANWKLAIGPEQFVFLEDQPIAAGASLTIYMGSGTNTTDSVYWGNSGAIIYNSGSRAVELMAPNRDIVETHSWGSATSSKQSVSAAIDITVNYDAQGSDSANPNGEWVNLTNLSSATVSLEDYHLYTDGTSYDFDAGDTIAAGERLRVYLGNGTDAGFDRYANGTLNTLNNTADEVSLRRDDSNGVVSEFSYPYTGQPLQVQEFAITAVSYDVAGADDDNPNGEYLEITNTGSSTANLRDYRVQYQSSTFYDFDDNTELAPGASIRISMGQGTDTATQVFWGNTEAALSNTSGELKLLTPYRTEQTSFAWDNTTGDAHAVIAGDLAAIVIDDVQMDAPGSDSTNPNGEWIVVRNAGASTADLTNWRIRDDSADYFFNDGEMLAAGATLKIFVGAGTDSGTARYWGNADGILNNDDGKLEVWSPLSQVVDAYAWGSDQSLNENARGAIRLSANYDTEGSDNANPNGEWVALFNSSDSAIDLTGHSLKSGSDTYSFASGTSLAAGANMRVQIGTGVETDLVKHWGKDGGILGNSGDRVELIAADDSVLLRHEWPANGATNTDYGIVIERANFDAEGSDSANPNGEFVTLRNASTTEQNLVNWKLAIGPEQFVFLEDTPLAAGASMTVYMGSGTDTTDSAYWGNSGGIMYNTGSRAIELMAPNREIVETHSWGSASSEAQSVSAAIEMTINYDAQGSDSANPNGEWVNLLNVSSQTVSLDAYHLYTDGTEYQFDADDTLQAGERLRIYLGNGTDSGFDRYANGALNTFNNTADGAELRRNDTDGKVAGFDYPFNGTALIKDQFNISAVNFDVPGVDDDNVNGEWVEITNIGSSDADLRDWRLQYQTGTFYDWGDSAVVGAGETIRISMGQGTDTATQFFWGNTEAALSNTSGDLTLLTPYREVDYTFQWRKVPGGGDTMVGTDGRNTIQTFFGDDDVRDGAGDDVIELGVSDDIVHVGGGKDSFDGGTGDDTISYFDSPEGVSLDLRDDRADNSWAEDDTITGFEAAIGSDAGDDRIWATEDDNTIQGAGGDDRISARGGDDSLEGGAGNDTLYGGSGGDTLRGGAGDDFLNGGTGPEDDILYGDAGADVFHFDEGESHDIIKDFEDDIDSIEFDDFDALSSVADAMGFATQNGDDVLFDFGSDGSLLVENTTLAALQDDISIV